jgi:hypothetical protein
MASLAQVTDKLGRNLSEEAVRCPPALAKYGLKLSDYVRGVLVMVIFFYMVKDVAFVGKG